MIIYTTHLLIVALTAWTASQSGLFKWYFIAAIALPVVLAATTKFSNISYALNARILLPISVGLLCVSLFHYVPTLLAAEGTNGLAIYGITQDTSGISEGFFEVNPIFKDAVSVLYALCAAFLLWKGLNDFDELKRVIHEEANQIRLVSDFAGYFEDDISRTKNQEAVFLLRKKLLSYLDNIIAGSKIVTSDENEEVLEHCLGIVSDLEDVDTNDQIALGEIMKGLAHVTVLRAHRTVCIEKRMSPYLLFLIVMMSITMVASFFGKATGELSMDYIYVGLLPAFYASIFMTLLDLSSPFDGYWSIKVKAVESAREKLIAQINRMKSQIA